MISLQRFILAFLTINIIVGFVWEIYSNPSLFSDNEIKEKIEEMEKNEMELKSEETGGLAGTAWQAVLSGIDTLMMPLRVLINIFNYFVEGILPFNINPSVAQHPIEELILYGIAWFRSMFWVLIAIEAYMFRMNKKVS